MDYTFKTPILEENNSPHLAFFRMYDSFVHFPPNTYFKRHTPYRISCSLPFPTLLFIPILHEHLLENVKGRDQSSVLSDRPARLPFYYTTLARYVLAETSMSVCNVPLAGP